MLHAARFCSACCCAVASRLAQLSEDKDAERAAMLSALASEHAAALEAQASQHHLDLQQQRGEVFVACMRRVAQTHTVSPAPCCSLTAVKKRP
jgi:hypothetical protein